jgi:hypothetical protein
VAIRFRFTFFNFCVWSRPQPWFLASAFVMGGAIVGHSFWVGLRWLQL